MRRNVINPSKQDEMTTQNDKPKRDKLFQLFVVAPLVTNTIQNDIRTPNCIVPSSDAFISSFLLCFALLHSAVCLSFVLFPISVECVKRSTMQNHANYWLANSNSNKNDEKLNEKNVNHKQDAYTQYLHNCNVHDQASNIDIYTITMQTLLFLLKFICSLICFNELDSNISHAEPEYLRTIAFAFR